VAPEAVRWFDFQANDIIDEVINDA